jgi:IS605 OrfB family transposase
MNKWINSLDQKQLALFSKSFQEHYVYGLTQEKSNSLPLRVGIEDTMSMNLSVKTRMNTVKTNSVTPEYLLTRKKKIWIHNTNSSQLTSLITKSSKILDQVSTSKEKGYSSYWNNHSKVISKNLSLPIKTDYVVSDSNSSLKSSSLMEGKSWFCMTMKKYHLNKNSSEISSLLQPFSVPDCMGYEVTHSKEKLGTRIRKQIQGVKYKTLKVPIFPTENEKKKLLHEIAQFKWYYNACIDILNMEENEDLIQRNSVSKISLRERLKDYKYKEESFTGSNLVYCSYQRRGDGKKEFPCPTWIEDYEGKIIVCDKVLERVIRGAIHNFTGNINSALSNKKNGNIKNFDLKYHTSKDENNFIVFDDSSYPAFHRKIKGVYSYRYSGESCKHRTRVSWNNLVNDHHPNAGISILYDKNTDKWYGCIPVERNWFPPKDHRSENQRNVTGEKIIGLDPGMRKFLTGMTSDGDSVIIGKNAYKEIIPILISISKTESELRKQRKGKVVLSEEEVKSKIQQKRTQWARVKNLICDMHWKTVKYLTCNYKYIFLEDFKVQSCIQGNIPSIVKRILNQYSFYQFKTRLQYGCETRGCKLTYVHPALTSKSCCNCGALNNVGTKEEYYCNKCNNTFDRDENAGTNIIIKGLTALVQ